MKFHENLKRIANEKGTSPTAVLKEMGVTTSKLAAWNRGALPKEEMMIRLAEALNCSVMDFFWDESDDKSKEEIVGKDDDEKDMLEIFRSLDRREKHDFMSMVYEFERRREIARGCDESAL